MSDDLEERVYGCSGPDIQTVAEFLAEALHIPLYANQSPMIGPWYSSIDYRPLLQALEANHSGAASASVAAARTYPEVMLQLNDPDPYYGGPSFPGGDMYITLVTGSSSALDGVEQALERSGLVVRRLK